MDTTEARYAEIARKMLELNDWVTPWFDYDVPFWGKPPLSFWVTALSFKLFGVNEFAARLPHYICGVFILWLVWDWAVQRSREEALYSVALLCGGILYLMSSGFVMTDMWLLLGTTLSMRGFWSAVENTHKSGSYKGWMFFIGLGIGLLAKGPVAVVLTGIPIFFWLIFTRRFHQIWSLLPWIRGSLLTAAIALPWYVIAELKTPGFLNYFLVGEHFYRFVIPGWKGDLYGSAHHFPRGTIWLFLLTDWLPWALLFPVMFVILWYKKRINKAAFEDRDWHLYLIMWALSPAVFFTAAGNILWPYVLPGFPGMALYVASWFANQTSLSHVKKERFLLFGLTITAIIMVIVILAIPITGAGEKKSAKSIIEIYNVHKKDNESIFYYGKRPFSASFYSNGKASEVLNKDELGRLIRTKDAFLAINKEDYVQLPDTLKNRLQFIDASGKYQLYQILLQ